MAKKKINEKYEIIDENITFYTIAKRFSDIIFGIIGCIILIPLYIGVKIACLLTKDTAPILFKQERNELALSTINQYFHTVNCAFSIDFCVS